MTFAKLANNTLFVFVDIEDKEGKSPLRCKMGQNESRETMLFTGGLICSDAKNSLNDKDLDRKVQAISIPGSRVVKNI